MRICACQCWNKHLPGGADWISGFSSCRTETGNKHSLIKKLRKILLFFWSLDSFAYLFLYFVLSVQSCFNCIKKLILIDEAVWTLLPVRGRRLVWTALNLKFMWHLGWFLQTLYLIIGTTKVWLFLQLVERWFITLLYSPPLLHLLRAQKSSINKQSRGQTRTQEANHASSVGNELHMDPNATNLIQPPLPAVLPLHHEIDTVRQRGQNPGCSGLECNSLALEVYAIDSFGSQRLERCTKEEDAD